MEVHGHSINLDLWDTAGMLLVANDVLEEASFVSVSLKELKIQPSCKFPSFQMQLFRTTQPQEQKIQWNLRKRTPPIMETSTMWTRVCGPELYSIILQLL